MDDAADHPAIINPRLTPRVGRKMRSDLRKLGVGQPKTVENHQRFPFGSCDSRQRAQANHFTGPSPKTYRQALVSYHLSAEGKFENHFDRGRTQRRHVRVANVIHIGKEANKWEEQYFTGLNVDEQIEYGAESSEGVFAQDLGQFVQGLGEREAAKRLGVSRMTLRKALARGCGSLGGAVKERISRRLLAFLKTWTPLRLVTTHPALPLEGVMYFSA